MTSDMAAGHNAAAREIVSRYFYPRVGKLDAQTENQASEAIAEALDRASSLSFENGRQEGRREGLEEAAGWLDKRTAPLVFAFEAAEAIRALAWKE